MVIGKSTEHEAEAGSLIFIQEQDKRRPYLCIKVFTNNAGVPYNWLVLPVTSKNTVGEDNLYKIEHPKLSKESYVKLNNLKTIPWNEGYEVKQKINKLTLDQIIQKLCKQLNYEQVGILPGS
jgi:mRNA-degrading endonuclease toxin of MazEF toxin-antitoxin module